MSGFMSSSTAMTIFDGVGSKFAPDSLKSHVFTDAINADDKRLGWVGIGDPLDLEFALGLDQGGYAAFSLRVDSRAVSSGAVAIQLAETIRQKEAAGETVKGKARKELKEAITSKLTSMAPFVPALTDCLWDLENERLLVSSTSEKTLQSANNLFQSTFGITPLPLAASGEMPEIFADICRNEQYECGDYVISPFGSASLSTPDQQEEKSQIAIQNNLPAICAALDEGFKIQKLRLVASSEMEADLILDFTLDASLAVSGLKLPKADKDAEFEAEFLLKADVCSKVASIVEKLAAS